MNQDHLSTGPKTEEGKQRSRVNAYKHGLTGQTLLLSAEERTFYDQHVQGYMDVYKPATQPEKVLVQIIADDYWRAMQGRSMETRSEERRVGKECRSRW